MANPPTPTPTVEASPARRRLAQPDVHPNGRPDPDLDGRSDAGDGPVRLGLPELPPEGEPDGQRVPRAEAGRDRARRAPRGHRQSVQRTDEMVHVRHIVVDNQDSLQQVQQKLGEGVPFDQVAKDFSTDTATRDKGGDLGGCRAASRAPRSTQPRSRSRSAISASRCNHRPATRSSRCWSGIRLISSAGPGRGQVVAGVPGLVFRRARRRERQERPLAGGACLDLASGRLAPEDQLTLDGRPTGRPARTPEPVPDRPGDTASRVRR